MLIERGLDIRRLGSFYGGWYICHSKLYQKSRILSLGAGEDISFDAEIANEYGCIVDIFDPTPKAVQHFKKVKQRFGKNALTNYSKTGTQEVCAYNLKNVNENQITFTEKAVWIQSGSVQFFVPLNEENVSHTITAYNSRGNHTRKSIQVTSIDILNIKIEKYDVLKLDIEGAEIPVLKRLIRNKEPEKSPQQILVEFDELQIPELANFRDVYLFHKELKNLGYQLVKKEKFNFTYVKV